MLLHSEYLCLFFVKIVTNHAKIGNVSKKNSSVVYATDTVQRGVWTILAKNQIFLSEEKWDEIRK